MIITISDFPPTTWNLTSVKHNSDSVKTTSLCSPMFCKYQQIWFSCQGTAFGGLEGLCILLGRLAYLCRYSDLLERFGRPEPEMSMTSSTVVSYIYENNLEKLFCFH